MGVRSFCRPWLPRSPPARRIAELEGLADATLIDPAVVRLTEGHAQAGLSEQRFTTRDMLAAESSLIEAALARRNSRVGVSRCARISGNCRSSPTSTSFARARTSWQPAGRASTAKQLAALLRVRKLTAEDYARRGLLPSLKLGRHRRFMRSDVIDAIGKLSHGG